MPVDQQMDIPATVIGSQLPEKKLEVDRCKSRPSQQAAVSGADVQCSKDHPLGVASLKFYGIG